MSSDYFFLWDILQFRFIQGYTKVIYLEEGLNHLKSSILKPPTVIVNIFYNFTNENKYYFIDIDSQTRVGREEKKLHSLDEMIENFTNQNSEENLNFKSIAVETTKLFIEF